MRVGKLIAVAPVVCAGALIWASLPSGLPAPSSVVYAATTSGELDSDQRRPLQTEGACPHGGLSG
jgi:hypothetical protein